MSCLSVRASVCPHGTTHLPPDGFSLHSIFEYFRKIVEKIQVSLTFDKNNGYFTWRQYTFFIISRSFLLRMRNVSDKSCRENQDRVFSNFFFLRKSCLLWDNVGKYCSAGQVTDDNMASAHCMLDAQGYRHTLSICNTDWCSTATIVVRTRLRITLIRTLPVLLINIIYVFSTTLQTGRSRVRFPMMSGFFSMT